MKHGASCAYDQTKLRTLGCWNVSLYLKLDLNRFVRRLCLQASNREKESEQVVLTRVSLELFISAYL
ncbi:hypothetical protein VCHA53P481_250022 [Vibrio chagasii]|nr:hypothetical protein VCHA49P379_10175 [Vibrio chagasii]CAH7164059.1 hypothetical protein VCHA53P481_250022 [Vibrio chagasii]